MVLLAGMVLGLLQGKAQGQTTYTWTQNSAATQDWTAGGNWNANGVFTSNATNRLQFFADTTTALANGTNSITTNVPASPTMNVLTLNGLGAAATGATNITIASSASTWTLGGSSPTVNLNGLVGSQGLNYTVAAKLALGANTTFTGNGTANFTFSGVISGTGPTLTKTGSSTLSFSGTNTYTGTTTVSGGTLKLNGASGKLATGSLIISGGGTFLIDNATNNLTARLTASGGPNLILGSNSSFLGGTFQINGHASSSATETIKALTINSGASAITASSPNTTLNFTPATISRVMGGTVSFTLEPINASVRFTNGGFTNNAGGIIGGYAVVGDDWATVSSTKVGTYNSYQNSTDPSAWVTTDNVKISTTLDPPSSTFPGTIHSLNFTGGNSLDLGSNTLVLTSGGILSSASGGTITNGTLNTGNSQDLIAFVNGSSTLTLDAVVAGSGIALTKSGTGTLVLSQANTNTGGTFINQGTLRVGNGGTTGALGSGTVHNNAALVFNRSNNFTVTNTIDGIGTLTQSGGGIATLTGTNTYSGTTAINAGALLINGNQSGATGAVSVNNTGTLGGTGTVGGAITVASGGIIRGGDDTAVGTLTIGNGLTLNGGSTVALRINAAGTTDATYQGLSSTGSNNSLLSITGGTTTINSGTKFAIDGSGATFTQGQAYSYTIMSGAGDQHLLSITNPSQFSTINFSNASDFAFSVTGDASGHVFVNFTPVPEPATVLGIAVAALGVGRLIRRRLRKPTEVAATTAA
jgi:fibronectin-binding autotransporter adhesin